MNRVLEDPALEAAIVDVLGPLASAHPLPRASQSDVWRIVTKTGESFALKRAHQAVKFRQETQAFAQWGAGLQRWLPEVVAVLDAPVQAIVLRWVDGQPATDRDVDAATRRALHRQAGEFRRAMETLPFVDDDPMPVADALATRLDRWCERAVDRLAPATLSALRARFEPSVFTDARRTPCHRDFSPWNWIVGREPAPRLFVIDFGQARPDVPLTDVLKLWDRPWREDPAARDAYFEGYGRSLAAHEWGQVEQLGLLHGLATAVWGREHDDPHYAALGDEVLTRLLEGDAP